MPQTYDIQEALTRYFGFSEFRPGQKEVISQIIDGDDVLAVMPTGHGKSLCYQLPALLRQGLTVVISPLVALMKDQVDALARKGFTEATFINSSLSTDEQHQCLAAMKDGVFRLVYIAPERFRSRAFLNSLRATSPSLFVVDEAHCISQWGHDFRPDYLVLSQVIKQIGSPQIAAFTATATPDVRDDIVEHLGAKEMIPYVRSVSRPNLAFRVFNVSDDENKLLWVHRVAKSMDGKGIIYCGKRRITEWLAGFLRKSGILAQPFHAGMSNIDRRKVQEGFIREEGQGRIDVVCATNAFGLGIDKQNVRFVIHYNIPGTVEAYYQEAGRAGRDGNLAACVLLYQYEDKSLQDWFIDSSLLSRQELETVFDVVVESTGVGGFRIVTEDSLENPPNISSHKVRMGLSVLERKGFVHRYPDVWTGISVHVENAQPQDSLDETLLALFAQQSDWSLLKLTHAANVPLGEVVQQLYDMEFRGQVSIRGDGRALMFELLSNSEKLSETTDDTIGLEALRDSRDSKLRSMLDYAATNDCRAMFIQRYFGESDLEPCGRCDRCKASTSSDTSAAGDNADTEVERSDDHLTHAVLLAVRSVENGISRSLVAKVLTGSQDKTVRQFRYQELPTFGLLGNHSKRELERHIKLMVTKGYLEERRHESGRFRLLFVSEHGGQFLDLSGRSVDALKEQMAQGGSNELDEVLMEELRQQRRKLAKRSGVPAYVICHDKHLAELATEKPATLGALRGLVGMGKKRVAEYGESFLEVIHLHSNAPPPRRKKHTFEPEAHETVSTFLKENPSPDRKSGRGRGRKSCQSAPVVRRR